MTASEFIATLIPGALASAKASGVPASIIVAQAALESGWGTSGLAKRANNLFGVKASKSWTGPTIAIQTREYLSGKWVMVGAIWRKYESLAECLEDHAAFLRGNPRYAKCFTRRDATDFAWELQRAGYATDPQYALKLLSIIEARGLEDLDK